MKKAILTASLFIVAALFLIAAVSTGPSGSISKDATLNTITLTNSGVGGAITFTSTNGFTTTLQSSMQVTNVTLLLRSNANGGLFWSTNVSAGSGGTVTQQQIFIPDGTSGQHLAMGSIGPGWVTPNMIGQFSFPDGTMPTVSNRKDYLYYENDFITANPSATLVGTRSWRALTGGGGSQSLGNGNGYNGDFIIRVWGTNVTVGFSFVASMPSGNSEFIHGSNSQEVATWDVLFNQAPIFQVTNRFSFIAGSVANLTSGADPATSGIYWLADTNSTAWQFVYLVGSAYVTNRAESGTIVSNAVLGATRYRLTTWWKSNTNIVAYINETPVATNTTIAQLPTGVALLQGARITSLQSNVVGSAAPNMDARLNYNEFYMQYGSAR